MLSCGKICRKRTVLRMRNDKISIAIPVETIITPNISLGNSDGQSEIFKKLMLPLHMSSFSETGIHCTSQLHEKE
jgi:hypothetical protein